MTDDESPVIIVGAGLSGLAVALAVGVRGRRPVVLDASDKVGGAAAWSGGQVWVGANHVAAKAGIDDDLTRAEAYVRAIGEAHSELLDETALKRWLTVAPIAMRTAYNSGFALSRGLTHAYLVGRELAAHSGGYRR